MKVKEGDMDGIEFGTPPLRGGRSGPRRELQMLVVEALKARPGEWAKIETKTTKAAARGFAQSIRSATYAAYRPAGAFEAIARDADVWARYVGGAQS